MGESWAALLPLHGFVEIGFELLVAGSHRAAGVPGGPWATAAAEMPNQVAARRKRIPTKRYGFHLTLLSELYLVAFLLIAGL